MDNKKRMLITQGGLFIAMTITLEYATTFILRLPHGGKVVSLGMIPLLAFSLIYGGKAGIGAGVITGLIMSIIDPYVVHPMQFILDYPLAFGLVGTAGFFYSGAPSAAKMYGGIFTGMSLRLISHVLSGVLFFRALMPPEITNPWKYSLLYNLSHILPTFVLCIIIVPYLVKRFNSKLPQNHNE